MARRKSEMPTPRGKAANMKPKMDASTVAPVDEPEQANVTDDETNAVQDNQVAAAPLTPSKYIGAAVILESRLRPRRSIAPPVEREASVEDEDDSENGGGASDEDSEDDDEDSEPDAVYAEKIVDKRTRQGVVEYLIKWEGYDHDANEWVPEPEVQDELIRDFGTTGNSPRRRAVLKRDETFGDDFDDEVDLAVQRKRKRQKAEGSEQPRKKRGRRSVNAESDMDDDSDEGNKENKSIARTRKQGGKQKQGAVTSKKAHQAAQAAELSKRAEERATKVIPVQSPCDKKADISCCMVCAAREWRRAVQARDTHLIRRLEKWYRQDIAVPRWAARPDVAHDTALYDAILTNSRQVYDPIIEMSENDRVQPPTRFYQSDSAETGFASRNAYSHRVKTVNESRGNREGNNAFYRTVTRDPFAFLVVPFNRKNPDTKALQREDAILLRLLADHAVTTATIDDLMDEYPVFRDALARWGLYEAAAAGNAALTLHLVGLLENGYGFNHLHSEVLKTGDGASLPSFRKNQVLKKAFGNFAITPLEVAAIAPTAAFLKELYSAITSAEASEPDERGRTALHFAAGSSQPGCLKFLLEQGMDATKGDNMKVTPLLLAARYGREANVRLLVESVGSADHTVLKEGYTALHFASHFSQSAVVNLLLSLGAKPNGLDKKLKATPLIYASQQGNLEVVQALAEGGADLCLGDKMGRTPLMFASKNGHWDLVKFLLHAGVDTSALDTSENTALHYAAGYGWPDVVRLLIDVGDADVNVANNWKYTPLMVADMKGHMEVVRLLLSLPSVGVNHCDNEGFSMLHRTLTTAVTTANEAERLLEKTQLLLDRGADPNTQNLAGDTVLHLLAADKHPNLKKKPDEQPTTSATTVELGQGNEDSDGVVDMDMDPVEDGTDCEGIAQASDAVNGNSRHPTPSKSGESTDATSVLPATENEVVAMETDEVTADVGTTGESTTLLTEGVEKSQVVNEEPRVWRTFYIEDFENLRRKQLELFLQHGANLNAMNKADETPLSIALQSSNTVAISLFLEKGSDITITKVTKDGASGNILHYLLDIAQEADTRHMYFERYGSANYGRATGAQLWKNETEVVQTISTYLKNLSLEALQNLMVTPDDQGRSPVFRAVLCGIRCRETARKSLLSGMTGMSYYYFQSEKEIHVRNVDYLWDTLIETLNYVISLGVTEIDPPVCLPKAHETGTTPPLHTGWTALHLAAQAHQPRLISALCQRERDDVSPGTPSPIYLALDAPAGVDPSNPTDSRLKYKWEFTPLDQLWRDAVAELLKCGANPARVCLNVDDTPLLKVARAPMRIFVPDAALSDSLSSKKLAISDFIARCSGKGLDHAKLDGVTALMYFARRSQSTSVEQLLRLGADVNVVDASGTTVASFAAQRGDLLVLKALAAAGKLVLSDQDQNGNTVLMHAVSLSDAALARYLLGAVDDGVFVDTTNKQGLSALHLACRSGHSEIVARLLAAGANRHAVGHKGTSALIEAIKANSIDCVCHLLEGDDPSEINFKDESGTSALHYAVQVNNWKIVKSLVEAGASVECKDAHGQTPLHIAIQQSKSAINTSLRIERLLVKHGASTNAIDDHGRTPLHIAFVDINLIPAMHLTVEDKKRHDARIAFAAQKEEEEQRILAIRKKHARGDVETDQWLAGPEVELLVLAQKSQSKNVQPMKPQYNGDWEAPVTVKRKLKADPIEIVSWLLGVPGTTVNAADRFGRTPLHYAARVGAFTCSTYLVERGADIKQEDSDHNSPLQIGLLYTHIDYAIMLANRGANVLGNMVQPNGISLSTFKFALSNGFMALAYLIIEKGQPLLQAVHDALSAGKYHIAILLLSEVAPAKLLHLRSPNGQSAAHLCFDFEVVPETQLDWHEYCVEIAELLLEAGFDFEETDAQGRTPLHYAAMHRHDVVTKNILSRYPARICRVLDNEKRSALGYALDTGHLPTINLLLEAAENDQLPEDESSKNPSLIHLGVKVGSVKIAKSLIKLGAPMNQDGEANGKETALMVAINHRDPKLVDLLLSARADPNLISITQCEKTKQNVPEFPVFRALALPFKASTLEEVDQSRPKLQSNINNDELPQKGTPSILESILRSGANPNVVDIKSKRTPLQMSIVDKEWAKARLLVSFGADVNVVDPVLQRNPLQIALTESDSKLTIKTFLSMSPDVNFHDQVTGLTLLDYLLEKKQAGLFEQLLKTGADVNQRSLEKANPTNLTTLMKCVIENDEKTIRTIAQFSQMAIDWNATDATGKTILHHLVRPRETVAYRNENLIRFVVEQGAKLDVTDAQGCLPIDYASQNGDDSIANVLCTLGSTARVRDKNTVVETTGCITVPEIEMDITADAGRGRHELREVERRKEENANALHAKRLGLTVEQLREQQRKKALTPDPLLKLDKVATIVSDGETVYDILMSRTDCEKGYYGLNVFYKMQVVYNQVQNIYILWTRWGAVGETGMYQRTPYPTKEACIAEFCKIFKAKSGNDWQNRAESFVPKSGKYKPVRKGDNDEDVQLKSLDFSQSPLSRLPKGLQDVMRIITDIKDVYRSLESDDVNLPLGRVGRSQILQAYEVLCEIRDKVREFESRRSSFDAKSVKNTRQSLGELSNRFFELLPCRHAGANGTRPILRQNDVVEQMNRLAELIYLGTASDMVLAAHARRTEVHPLDYIAASLQCSFSEVKDRDCDEFQVIREYMLDSSADYEIVSLVKTERSNERETFQPYRATENRKLLWHGSRVCNMMGILSQGLKVAPVEANSTGYMFGKGIYFADAFCKSIGYCSTSAGYACLLLCEVALGKEFEREGAMYMEQPEEGTLSTKGLGKRGPSSEMVLAKDGVIVPRGPLTTYPLRKDKDGNDVARNLEHNEYIVYDPSQVRIRYMVVVRRKSECLLCLRYTNTTQDLGKHKDRYQIAAKTFDLPKHVLASNEYERAITRALLFAKKRDVYQLWTEQIGAYLQRNAYLKRWQPITQLSDHSEVCDQCSDQILEDMLYEFLLESRQELPAAIRSRPHCWWGRDCRSQTTKRHIQDVNHQCDRTRSSHEKNVFQQSPRRMRLFGDAVLNEAVLRLTGAESSSGAIAKHQLPSLHVAISVEFGFCAEEFVEFRLLSAPEPEGDVTQTVVRLNVAAKTLSIVASEDVHEVALPDRFIATKIEKRCFCRVKWNPAARQLRVDLTTTATEDGRAGVNFVNLISMPVDLVAAMGTDRAWGAVFGCRAQVVDWTAWEETKRQEDVDSGVEVDVDAEEEEDNDDDDEEEEEDEDDEDELEDDD